MGHSYDLLSMCVGSIPHVYVGETCLLCVSEIRVSHVQLFASKHYICLYMYILDCCFYPKIFVCCMVSIQTCLFLQSTHIDCIWFQRILIGQPTLVG